MTHDPITMVAAGANEEVSFQRYRLTHASAAGESSDVACRFSRRLIHIGSSPDNDFALDHPTVSRVRARLEFQRHGYLLTDLASKNGIWVDGLRVREAFLRSGATLRFGQADVGFVLEEERVQVELSRATTFGRLIGKSSQMREIFALLGRVAPSDVTVLVEGESGTGKELVAEALHLHCTSRRSKPFVIFDCSAVAPELIESELFGHVRGAFTGAVAKREGVFGEADGGTLFLDEIGELPLDLQPKLLRALESGEVKPVGGNERRRVDVRVIAATNRQLDHEIDAGAFRRDLYYRLAVIKVRIPPLRQRIEDIPLLVEHFLARAADGVRVGFDTMRKLQAHSWPGNVRELKNYVDRAVILADDGRLSTQHLSTDRLSDAGGDAELDTGACVVRMDFDLPFKDAKARLVDTFERRYWVRLLEEAAGNVSEAARRGGIHRKSLEYLLKKLDLR